MYAKKFYEAIVLLIVIVIVIELKIYIEELNDCVCMKCEFRFPLVYCHENRI